MLVWDLRGRDQPAGPEQVAPVTPGGWELANAIGGPHPFLSPPCFLGARNTEQLEGGGHTGA